jgi:nitrite transporter
MARFLRRAGSDDAESLPMYLDTVDHFAGVAQKRSEFLKRSPLGFWISAMMAGAYVGMGIILIFSVGSDADPGYRALIMGASFGIALTLVVFAGSDLFTGHTMFMPLGLLRQRIGWGDLASAWAISWLGNLVGAAGLAALFVLGGGGGVLHSKSGFLLTVAAAKMNAPAIALFARAILCNWLVCLALWMSARMTSDAAKCIAIFWCLFAFIGSGFEHSVANMTLLAIALLSDHPETITVGGLVYNLVWVTLGNIVSGAIIMGAGYWTISRPMTAKPVLVAARDAASGD